MSRFKQGDIFRDPDGDIGMYDKRVGNVVYCFRLSRDRRRLLRTNYNSHEMENENMFICLNHSNGFELLIQDLRLANEENCND